MKYLPLIWAGIWRKRARALLLLLQIVSAFTLFGLLQGLNSGIKQAIARTHGDRLYIVSSVALLDPLPLALLERIRAVAGVRYVSPRIHLVGSYQRPGETTLVAGIDPAAFFEVYSEWLVSRQAIEALKKNRAGLIVGDQVMKRYGWKVGQRIALQSAVARKDGAAGWTFDIVGEYAVPKGSPGGGATISLANWEYLNESRLLNRDHAELFVARIDSPANATGIALAIDNASANSDHETHTLSEADVLTSQVQRIADLDFIVGGIIAAVFFALLLATGALMMQSIRERISELAVMKTVGFSDRRIMALILVEAAIFCVLAAGIGLGLATLILPIARAQIGIAGVPPIVVLAGIGFALLLALLGGLAPAWRGLRLRVVDALAER